MREKNPYELLQVSENADQEIIRAAWHRLMQRYHPDKSQEPNATELTQRLNDAYEILSDPARREQYDKEHGLGRARNISSGTGQTTSPPPEPPKAPPRPKQPPRSTERPRTIVDNSRPRSNPRPAPERGQRSPINGESGTNPWLMFAGLAGAVAIIVLVAAALIGRSSDPDPDPKSLFLPLADEFQDWRIRWVELYGEPPYVMQGNFSKGVPIQLPMCGLVTAHGGYGFKGFEASDSVELGHQEIVLAGSHKLDGSIWSRRDYTVEVRPPRLLGVSSVTKKYNEQLREFMDMCTQ